MRKGVKVEDLWRRDLGEMRRGKRHLGKESEMIR